MGQTGSFTDDFARYGGMASGEVDFNSFLPDTESGIEADVYGNYAYTASTPSGPSAPTSNETTTSDGVGSDDPRSACTWNLTSLLRDMDKIWSRLPSTSFLHTQQDSCGEHFVKSLSEKMPAQSALETIFALAQRLIDAYPTVMALSLAMDPGADSVPCNLTDCIHTLQVNPTLRGLEEQITSQGMFAGGADLSLASLLVACHTRLLDILDRVFLLVSACDRITLATRREPQLDLSELRVGSFVPQRTGAMLMQIALLRYLVASLSGRLASFGKAIAAWSEESSAETDLEGDVLRLQHELLTKRQAIKVTQVAVIEQFLSTFDSSKIGT